MDRPSLPGFCIRISAAGGKRRVEVRPTKTTSLMRRAIIGNDCLHCISQIGGGIDTESPPPGARIGTCTVFFAFPVAPVTAFTVSELGGSSRPIPPPPPPCGKPVNSAGGPPDFHQLSEINTFEQGMTHRRKPDQPLAELPRVEMQRDSTERV